MGTVVVRGTGTARTSPDEATVGLELSAVRPSAKEALADVASTTASALALCDELGIAPERRSTAGANVAEHGEHVNGQWQHRGYRAWNRLSVRIDSAELAGALMSEAVSRVGAAVDGPAWSIAVDNPAHLVAAAAAARDARARAQAYADALGLRLGAVLSVREPGTRPPTPPMPQAMMAKGAYDAVESLPVAAGEHELVCAVEIEFGLDGTQ